MTKNSAGEISGALPYFILWIFVITLLMCIRAWTVQRPDLRNTFLFKFGQPITCGIVPEQQLWKFNLKSDLGIYVFNPRNRNMVGGCGIHFPYSNTVSIRSGVSAVFANKDLLRRFWEFVTNLKINDYGGVNSQASMS